MLYDAGRLWADVTAEVPVTVYPPDAEPDRGRVAGVDLGIIHPHAGAGPSPGAPRNPGSAGHGGGDTTGAASGSSRRGTPAVSARPSTKPPAP